MNLFEIYDAVIENAKMNDLVFNAEAVQEYADVVFNVLVSDEQAAMVIEANKNWLESERGSHNYDILVKSVLEAIEV